VEIWNGGRDGLSVHVNGEAVSSAGHQEVKILVDGRRTRVDYVKPFRPKYTDKT
jgi:hypothetical protein